ncbi:MAG: stage II sporulation protein P [bacterium]|nr:stage II sporulation protein P [bacterium]
MRIRTKKQIKKRRIWALIILLFCVSSSFLLEVIISEQRTASEIPDMIERRVKDSLYDNVVDYYLPLLSCEEKEKPSLSGWLFHAVMDGFPIYTYAADGKRSESIESKQQLAAAEYEALLEKQMYEENEVYLKEQEQMTDNESWEEVEPDPFFYQMEGSGQGELSEQSNFSYATKKKKTISMEELTDYKVLIERHYRIDSTTSSNAKQLNASNLIQKDLTLKESEDGPQILIYHTHSQEGFRDTKEGDSAKTVVGLGDYLAEILSERYGYRVLHDKGTYDKEDRDRAYAVAGPALEKILSDYPTIEVVIDLHRDGISESTRLLTEVNDTVMAPIMFFNGLSYTNKNGKIDELPNDNLETNLAFSLQTELLASEYYPGLSRHIYLKGLRYNMHYCPKSMLVEVGAQTNTYTEAQRAIPPLADVLNRVLSGEKP